MLKKPLMLVGAALLIFGISACGSSKDTADEEEVTEVDAEDTSRELSEEEQQELRDELENQQEEEPEEMLGSEEALEAREEAREAHEAIDYTDPDFHPSEAGEDVEKMILSEEGRVNESETLDGDYEILYTNGFQEEGTYQNGNRIGEWRIYNRDNQVVRIDHYENGQRTDFEIKK